MILSIEAFIKQVDCYNCGKPTRASETLCEECSKLLQKDQSIEKSKDSQTILIKKEKTANENSNKN